MRRLTSCVPRAADRLWQYSRRWWDDAWWRDDAGRSVLHLRNEPAETGGLFAGSPAGISGIVASRDQPGVYFVHQDRLCEAIAFAVDESGVFAVSEQDENNATPSPVEFYAKTCD